jgi:hypothetical protein
MLKYEHLKNVGEGYIRSFTYYCNAFVSLKCFKIKPFKNIKLSQEKKSEINPTWPIELSFICRDSKRKMQAWVKHFLCRLHRQHWGAPEFQRNLF